MTEMFGEAWPPMSVPDLAPDDDDDDHNHMISGGFVVQNVNIPIIQSLCNGLCPTRPWLLLFVTVICQADLV